MSSNEFSTAASPNAGAQTGQDFLESATTSSGARRLMTLDVVRGLALCGILFANIGTIMGVFVEWPERGQPPVSYSFLHLVFQERFFPFSRCSSASGSEFCGALQLGGPIIRAS